MQRDRLDLLLLLNSKVVNLSKESELLYSSSHDQTIALDCYIKVLTLILKELDNIK